MDRQFISYPKSGRSWIRFVVYLLGLEPAIRFHHDGCEFSVPSRPPLALDFAVRLRAYENDGRIVYLRRDPRDVMVSLYFQIKGRMGKVFDYRGEISSFIRDDYFGARSLIRFDRQWLELCRRNIALCISYEECHADILGTTRKILDWYELPIDEGKLRDACDRATFDRMQAVEIAGTFEEPWLRPRNGAMKTRRGVTGGYADYLSDNDISFIDSLISTQDLT